MLPFSKESLKIFYQKPVLLPLIGLVFGAMFWLVDGFVDFIFFNEDGSAFHTILFYPEPMDFWMRSVVIVILLIFGFISRSILLAEMRAKLELESYKLDLERKVDERTREIQIRNEVLGQEIATRKQMEVALRYERDRAQNYLDTVEAIIVVLDTEGRVTTINRKGCQLVGYGENELLGKSWFATCLPQSDGFERVYQYFLKIISGDQAITKYFENSIVTRSGELIQIAWHNALLRDEQGRITGTLSAGEDITRRKQAAAEIVAAKNLAEQANKAKSQFLSNMSHELRTPLNAILGFGQLLEIDADSSTSDQQESVKHILAAGYQLLGLVNDMLDLSRIDIGKLELNMQPLSIASLASSCVEQVAAAMANQRNVNIENRITDTALLVQGDGLRLQQVLINLLSNAVKYNQEKGRVTIGCRIEEEGRLRVEVCDTGYGIASDKLPLLFTPFERLDQKHGSISGVGIGLCIAKKLVEAMNGTVGVESVQGEGSTFWFALPLVADAHESTLVPGKTCQLIPQADSRFVVLYIEDNPVNVQLMERVLKSRPGIELLTAGAAEEGLRIAEKARPDLILMDVKLPGIDGITATTLLKGIDATRDIPVVALSANAMKEDIDRALGAGCSAYLTKPIDLQALYETIDKIRLAEI